MAEFIFDLQRFDDGDNGDTGDTTSNTGDNGEGGTAGSGGSSGAGSSSGSGSGGTSGSSTGGSNSGSEVASGRASDGQFDGGTRGGGARWGYYTYDQWSAIRSDAVSNYDQANTLGTVNIYSGITGVADNILVSRYAINEIYNVEPIDTITFFDTPLTDFPGYYYGEDVDSAYNVTGRYVAPILNIGEDSDSGAGSVTVIHYGADELLSPTLAFADGQSVIYSDLSGRWITPEELSFSVNFWSNYLPQIGIDGFADFIFASRGINNLITNVDSDDTIYLSDTSLFTDLQSASYVSNGIALTFNNGTSTFVEYSGTFSPTFILGSGESFVYNSTMGAWRTPAEAVADAWAYATESLIPEGYDVYLNANDFYSLDVSINNNTFVDNAGYNIINFTDATPLNVTNINADNQNDTVSFEFNTGKFITVEYWTIFSPLFVFADNSSVGYDYNTSKWGTAYRGTESTEDIETFTLSGLNDNLVYDASWMDSIYIPDITRENIQSVDVNGSYIHINFTAGDETKTTAVRYTADEFGYGWSPHFILGSTGAQTEYFYSGLTGTWIPVGSSGSSSGSGSGNGSSGSADLWGDTFSGTAAADEIFVGTAGNTFVQNVDEQDTVTFGATLSDIVTTSVEGNTIAIALNTGVTAVIETAGTSPTFNLASGESYTYDNKSASWKTA